MEKVPHKPPVISSEHARGLRRHYARATAETLHTYMDRFTRSGGKRGDYLQYLKGSGGLAAERRRAPSQGIPAGIDVIELSTHEHSGALEMMLVQVDKRGWPTLDGSGRLLLRISNHATEA